MGEGRNKREREKERERTVKQEHKGEIATLQRTHPILLLAIPHFFSLFLFLQSSFLCFSLVLLFLSLFSSFFLTPFCHFFSLFSCFLILYSSFLFFLFFTLPDLPFTFFLCLYSSFYFLSLFASLLFFPSPFLFLSLIFLRLYSSFLFIF